MLKAILATPKQNHIIAMLPQQEYLRLESELELVHLSAGQILQESGCAVSFLYFPTTCIVSLLRETSDGEALQLAITGRDGLVGVSQVQGNELSNNRMLVQTAGSAYRVRTQVAQWIFDQGGKLTSLVTKYADYLMSQIAQIALCNHNHTVEQQLCRWILLSLDQLPDHKVVYATQEMISALLGVRRASVSEAASNLQAAGYIRYTRGQIAVLDRGCIESVACGCYATLKQESARLLQPAPQLAEPLIVPPSPQSLRIRAENRLNRRDRDIPMSPGDKDRLLHELQIHQIELEIQNEELSNQFTEASAARDRYADIYDFSPLGYMTVDAIGTVMQLNLAAAILLGVKRSETPHYRFGASLSASCAAKFFQFLNGVLDGRTRQSCEVELNPTAIHESVTVHIDAISDELGHECRMVIRDVTEQRRNQYLLRKRDRYQQALLDTFPFMVWLKDEKSRFLAVNHPFADRFGSSSTEALVGKSDFDITNKELAEAYIADDQSVLESGKSKIVEEWIEELGERRWSETFKSPVTLDERVIGTVGFARDITERKTQEVALLESEKLFRTLAEIAPVGIFLSDRDGQVSFANSCWCAMAGISSNAAVGKNWKDALHPEDRERVSLEWEKGVLSQSDWESEFRLLTLSKRTSWIRALVTPIRSESNNAVRYLEISLDISEQKRSTEALSQYHEEQERIIEECTTALSIAKQVAEVANRTKAIILSNVSHELRTPMNIIIGMIEMAKRRNSDPKTEGHLGNALDAARRLLLLINDMLQMSLIETKSFELTKKEFCLEKVISDIKTLFLPRAAARGLSFDFDICPDLANINVHGDSRQLAQVLILLIDNALKFTEHGHVSLRVSLIEDNASDLLVRFEVHDSGIGMSSDIQARMFDLFEQGDSSSTRQYGGTGLGLALCKELVELMDGSLKVESKEGSGSSFMFQVRWMKAVSPALVADNPMICPPVERLQNTNS